ncbi:PIN/TRAM domain-containing protein [Planctomycetales bacterium]|nr:PIN/TRAM domain-containing protein [Planctomycetales bacterium]
MGLFILRGIFLVIAAGIGIFFLNSDSMKPNPYSYSMWPFIGTMAFALLLIFIDVVIPKKRAVWISSIYFGILIGLLLTIILGYALTPLFVSFDAEQQYQSRVMILIGMSLCYFCTSLLVQTKDDFRFIIPYVEFRKNVKGIKPVVMDTSTLVDGRLADIVDTNIMDNVLIAPKFVVEDLQRIANSGDKNRRIRGRRGLDVLNKLQSMQGIEVQIDITDLQEFKGQPDDLKLITLCKYREAKLMTNEYSLNKVAKVHGITVINLNDLATSMKPIFLPGEKLNITVMKRGEEPTQGVGYLEDGTMVVIDDGSRHVNERVAISVTSILQTSAGRMIFAQLEFATKKDERSESNEPPVRSRYSPTLASSRTNREKPTENRDDKEGDEDGKKE